MLKRTLCQAKFTWELCCDGPLLIADGRYNQDVIRNELTPAQANERKGWYPGKVFINRKSIQNLVATIIVNGKTAPVFDNTFGFYVPGTSIRGPFRSQAERIIRTLAAPNAVVPQTACDPFKQNEPNDQYYCCTKVLETQSQDRPYARACPACKIFGAAGLASRLQVMDAPITQGNSVYRDMIGIDRFTGGVYQGGDSGGGANIKLHALENTKFQTTISITNFELWHLGLIAYVFKDFEDGLVPIGFGKTKGFGQVTGKVKTVCLTFSKAPNGLEHMGSLMDENERPLYDITESTSLQPEGYHLQVDTNGGLSWYHKRTIPEGEIHAFLNQVKGSFNHFIAALAEAAA